MKRKHFSVLIASMIFLTSCDSSFMQGMMAGAANYGYGGLYNGWGSSYGAVASNGSYGGGSSSYSGGSSSSTSSSASSSSSSSQPCHLCHGLGKCWTCNGKRTYLNPLTGKNIACPNCTDGLCSHCHGSGKK